MFKQCPSPSPTFTSLIVQIKPTAFNKDKKTTYLVYIPHSSDKTSSRKVKKGIKRWFTSLIVQIKPGKEVCGYNAANIVYIPHSSDKTDYQYQAAMTMTRFTSLIVQIKRNA